MIFSKRFVLPVVVAVVVLVLAVFRLPACNPSLQQLDDARIWSDKFFGLNLYYYYDEAANELLILKDQKLYGIDLAKDPDDLVVRKYQEDWTADRGSSAVPLVGYLGDDRVVLAFFDEGGVVSGWNTKAAVFQSSEALQLDAATFRVRELFEQVVAQDQAFTPVMFTEQSYSFGKPGRWYKLLVTAEKGGKAITYELTLWRMAAAPAELNTTTAPGYHATPLQQGITVWVYDGWKDGHLDVDIEAIAASAVEDWRGFFGDIPVQPVNLVAGPAELMISIHPYVFSLAEAVQSLNVVALYDCDFIAEDIVRHEVFHLIHGHAVLPAHSFRSIPGWVFEGLATHFQRPLSGVDLRDVHRVTPLDFSQDPGFLNRVQTSHYFGAVMIEFLIDQYGSRTVVSYATHPRPPSIAEDEVTKDYFGLTQMEILKETVTSTPGGPVLPDDGVRLADSELITGNEGFYTVFLSPSGSYIALPAAFGDTIRVLDVRTAEVSEALSNTGQPKFRNTGCISWFPDESRILFSAALESGDIDIYSVSIEGNEEPEEILVSEEVDSAGSVSPSGRQIAFRSERTGASEIYTLDLSTGAITQLTQTDSRLLWPAWSPDEQRIAFVDEGRDLLGIYDFEAGGVRWIDMQEFEIYSKSRPQWLSEAEVILSAQFGDNRLIAVSVNVATGEMSTWGGNELTTLGIVPTSEPNEFYVCTWLFDNRKEVLYTGIIRASFARNPR